MENKYSLQLAGYIKEKNWTAVSGYIFFIGLMAAGYAYNLTFVQLGLVDLGKRVVGLSDSQVAAQMALLAFVTCVTALLFGYFMKRHERVSRLPGKLRLIVAVVAAQAILTGIIPLVQTRGVFTAWVFFASLALGVGVPATFSLAVDLVPVRDRGLVAALITSLAYLGAAVLFPQSSIEKFRTIFLWPMVAGVNPSLISRCTLCVVLESKAANLSSKLYFLLAWPIKSRTVRHSSVSVRRRPRPSCCKNIVNDSVGRRNKTVFTSGISMPSL
jgi:MFS family permease